MVVVVDAVVEVVGAAVVVLVVVVVVVEVVVEDEDEVAFDVASVGLRVEADAAVSLPTVEFCATEASVVLVETCSSDLVGWAEEETFDSWAAVVVVVVVLVALATFWLEVSVATVVVVLLTASPEVFFAMSTMVVFVELVSTPATVVVVGVFTVVDAEDLPVLLTSLLAAVLTSLA